MAKIGTAHVEIKPVLNEEALEAIGLLIEKRIERALALGKESLDLADWVHVDTRGLLINGQRLPFYLADKPVTISRDASGFASEITVTLLARHASTSDDVASVEREHNTSGPFGVSTTTYRNPKTE